MNNSKSYWSSSLILKFPSFSRLFKSANLFVPLSLLLYWEECWLRFWLLISFFYLYDRMPDSDPIVDTSAAK